MQSRARLLLSCVTFNLAIVFGLRADADFLLFDDSEPGGTTVTANGFIGAPLTLDGSIVLTNNTYTNQTITLANGQDITFFGTDTNFSSPFAFNTIYDYVYASNPTLPVAELLLTGTISGGEHFTGTFIGSGSPSLPTATTAGHVTEVLGPEIGYTGYFTIGGGPNSTGIGVVVPAEPTVAPEPSTFALFGIATSGLGFYGWRRRKRHAE